MLVANDIDESPDTLWNPPEPDVSRKPSDIVAALTPMLRCCSEVKIVDPHLDLEKEKWSDTIGRILNELPQNRAAEEIPQVEVYTSIDQEFKPGSSLVRTPEEERNQAQALADICEKKLKGETGYSGVVKIFVWAQKDDRNQEGFDWIHNRYVLTDIGGILFGYGTDAPGQGTDDLLILPKDTYMYRWLQYSGNSPAFRLILER